MFNWLRRPAPRNSSRRNARIDAEVRMIAERFSRPPYRGVYYDEQGRDWLLIPGYPLPERFAERRCDLLLTFPEGYPEMPPVGFYLNKRFALRHMVREALTERGEGLGFSSIDTHYEAALARYLAERMQGAPYGSVVVNDDALDARLWITHRRRGAHGSAIPVTTAQPLSALRLGDLERLVPLAARRRAAGEPFISPIYDRQVRAFGRELQTRLAGLRVGVIGLGGLGSATVDQLARLGVARWVLVDWRTWGSISRRRRGQRGRRMGRR